MPYVTLNSRVSENTQGMAGRPDSRPACRSFHFRETPSMPVNPPGIWGIDVGLCALKAIRLENINGQVTATAFDYVEHSKILSQPDADPDALTREALEKFLSRNNLKGDQVAICVP